MATQNTLFALFAASEAQKVIERLQADQITVDTQTLPIRSYNTGESSWLIIGPSSLTTIELSNALGITDGTNGSGILVRAENYYGRASKAIWEWVTAKMGESLDAAAKQ